MFNLDSALIAIGGVSGTELFAYPVQDVSHMLVARASTGERLASFGVTLQDLAGPLLAVFGEDGVLISAVVDGGPADVAGIQPGDVLLAIAGVDVPSAEVASRALSDVAAGTATKLRVLTGGRARTTEVTPAPAYEVAALARIGLTSTRVGPEARVLLPTALLDRAGIPHNAHVMSVNGRTVSSRSQITRELRRGNSPARLLIRHEGRQFFAVIGRDR